MKKELTPTEKLKKRNKWVERLDWIIPVCFWVLIALSIVCFVIAISYSVGNFKEITSLLNSKKYTGEELRANYEFLIGKYGEWIIGNGGAGFTISFVNIGRAVFGAMTVFNFTISIVFLLSAFVLGKWTLPKLQKSLERDNKEMVDVATLEIQEKINQNK